MLPVSRSSVPRDSSSFRFRTQDIALPTRHLSCDRTLLSLLWLLILWSILWSCVCLCLASAADIVVESWNTFQAHLSDSLSFHRWGFRTMHALYCHVICHSYKTSLVQVEAFEEPRPGEEAQERGVSSLFDCFVNSVHGLLNLWSVSSGIAHNSGRLCVWLNRQVTIRVHEERFTLCEENDSFAVVASSSCSTHAMNVLISTRRETNLNHEINIWEVHATSDNV